MNTPVSFETATAVKLVAPLHYAATIPDGWQQGRGAFGGLVIGTLLRAMEHAEEDKARTLRSLTAEICAPALAGDAEVLVTVLRRGKGASFLDARLLQSNEVVARASSVLASARESKVELPALPRVAMPDWRSIEPTAVSPPGGPVFAQHLEYRPLTGGPSVTGDRAVARGYVRMKTAPRVLDAPSIVGLLDAWWPAIFAITGRRPCATIAFTMELFQDPSLLSGDEPLEYEARVEALREGYFLEVRELRSKGALVGVNQQTFVLLG